MEKWLLVEMVFQKTANYSCDNLSLNDFSFPAQTTTYYHPHVVPAENNPRFDPGSTSIPMRHPHPRHRPRLEALTLRVPPISTFLFPGAGSCQMPTPSKFPPATPPSDERSQAMKKWAEGRAHIQHLVDCDKTPPKEDCLLVFQCLMIMWCYINSYPSRLLKRFTVYDFVNFNENGSGTSWLPLKTGPSTNIELPSGLPNSRKVFLHFFSNVSDQFGLMH